MGLLFSSRQVKDRHRHAPNQCMRYVGLTCLPVIAHIAVTCARKLTFTFLRFIASNDYADTPNTHHHPPPNGISASSSPVDTRHAGGFYPTYPSAHSIAVGSGLPSVHDGMDQLASGPHGSSHAVAASQAPKESDEELNSALFGDLPESKRRKFILVEDTQRGTRVRVRVMLDQVKMDDLPDSYRKGNSVYPRSYFPTEMQSPPTSARGSRFFDDDQDDTEAIADPSKESTVGRTLVPVPMLDGSEAKIPLPRMNRSRRNKEVTLNDLGYRMSWSQSRVFAGRTLFLQRCRKSMSIFKF